MICGRRAKIGAGGQSPMKSFLKLSAAAIGLAATAAVSVMAAPSPGPTPYPMPAPIPAPQDTPYPGTIKLSVDATDTARGIYHIHETIPVSHTGDFVLLYPEWLPGHHSPTGPIDKFAGLTIHSGAAKLSWKRDTVSVFAFHVDVPNGTKSIDADFQFLSPVEMKEGRVEMTQEMIDLEWNEVSVYPAGYYSRDIMVQPTVKLPAGWQFGTALEPASAGATTTFKPVSYNVLVDSPMFAGKYFQREDLDPSGQTHVHMDIVADEQADLAITPQQLQVHRNLVQQAYKVFGSHHYDHYDFLLSLSDRMSGIGLEHHRSSEDGAGPKYFKDWDKTAAYRDLLSHEYTHSWNGKFRRPADLWTPNFNVPMRDSLLWVYEGQTEFWGQVLAARSGLWSKQQALDAIASDAATYDEGQPGWQWRPLEDTTNDPITTERRQIPWRSWQRSEDYYVEAELFWINADMIIRQQTHGQKSLNDFARTFFGVNNGSFVTVTYTFDDVVKALNSVTPYDWAGFLHQHLDAIAPAPLDGLKMGGYKLVYTDKQSDLAKSGEGIRHFTDLTYSLGIGLDKDGTAMSVLWDGPAFNAGLTIGSQIVAIENVAYDSDRLKDAITDAKTKKQPLQLLIKRGDTYRTVSIPYYNGLRYPHLERIPNTPAMLDDLLAPMK
jgi:predicted metalloprotease with PDZ domain